MQILTHALSADSHSFKRSGSLLKSILKRSSDLPSPSLNQCYESIARMLGYEHKYDFDSAVKACGNMIYDFPDELCPNDLAETRIVHQARRLALHQEIPLDRALEITKVVQPSATKKLTHDDDSIKEKLKFRFPELHYADKTRVNVLIDLKHDMSEIDVGSYITWLQFDNADLSKAEQYIRMSDTDDVFLYGADNSFIRRAESLLGKGSVHLLI